MKDFNLAKYLKENYQGPFSMFQPYTDLNPLKEESEEQLDTEIPYEGPEPHLDGMGGEYDQVDPVEEAMGAEQDEFDRAMDLFGQKVVDIANEMIDDGYEKEDAVQFLRDMANYIETNVI